MVRKLQFRSTEPQDNMDASSSNNVEHSSDKYSAQTDFFQFASLLLRKRIFIGGIVAGVMFLIAAYIFLTPNMYRSTATILPSGRPDKLSTVKELAGLANIGGSGEENSSQLFPIILSSNQVKDALVEKSFAFVNKGEEQTTTLAEYLGEENPDYLKAAIDGITDISADKKTGVITVSVETEYPELSQQILTQMLAELENFNLYKRKSQAASRERYLARELITRERELKESETELEDFQSVNRDWYGSSDPEILRTLADLQRNIEIKSKAYIFLKEQYEVARLDVQKDIPVVAILDFPSLPVTKSGPFRIKTILISGVISLLIAILLVALWDFVGRTRHGANKESFEALRQDLNKAFPVINRLLVESPALDGNAGRFLNAMTKAEKEKVDIER